MNNKEKLGLSTTQLIVFFVVSILNVISFVCNLILFSGNVLLQSLIPLSMFIVSIVYVLYGYKKPHGNLMRYLLLAYSAFGSVLFLSTCATSKQYLNVTNVVMLFLMVYMAGRLDHYKQNVIFCGVVLVGTIIVTSNLLTSLSNVGNLNLVTFFACSGSTTCWLAISISYIIRYKDHKDAGLQDK